MGTRLMGLVGPPKVVRDAEGHRDYRVTYRVAGGLHDGPLSALQCPGLPLWGTQYLIGNDIDLWAWCRWDATVDPVVADEPTFPNYYNVSLLFSSKPPQYGRGGLKYCKDNQYEDPLLQPQKVSGTFTKKTEEAQHDRFGRPIRTSSFEPISGPQVEFDEAIATVRIEQNVAALDLPTLNALKNCVNGSPLWGLDPHTVKLSTVTWEKKWYGTCFPYYTRTFDFDIDFRGFDRFIPDIGTCALNGHWNSTTGVWTLDNINGSPPDPTNPGHFIRLADLNGNTMRRPLNGKGAPAGTLGDGTVVLNTRSFDPQGLVADAQPAQPSTLAVKITANPASGNGLQLDGAVTIIGTDKDDLPLLNNVKIGRDTHTYYTRGFFKTITSITNRLFSPVLIVQPRIQIVAQDANTGQGAIFVSKYAEGEFLVLGIPTDL